MDEIAQESVDALEIRRLIDDWAAAVRRRDIGGILRHHAPDIVMFDVPPPFLSRRIDAYKETWSLFFGTSPDPAVFEIFQLSVIPGADVAFAVASMRGKMLEGTQFNHLDFRLTIGFRKIVGQWTFTSTTRFQQPIDTSLCAAGGRLPKPPPAVRPLHLRADILCSTSEPAAAPIPGDLRP